MRMRKPNAHPPPTAADRTLPTFAFADVSTSPTAADKAADEAFDALWRLGEQNKENTARKWGTSTQQTVSAPRTKTQTSPVGASARSRDVSSMPVPASRKRSLSPGSDPRCKKALSYDRPLVAAKSVTSSPRSEDNRDASSQRSPLFNSTRHSEVSGRSARRDGSPTSSPLSNASQRLFNRAPVTTGVVPLMEVGRSPLCETSARPRLSPRPSVKPPDSDKTLLSSEQKMRKALNIRPNLIKNKGRTLTERMKNSRLLHDVVLPTQQQHKTLTASCQNDDEDDIFVRTDELLAEFMLPPDSTTPNPFMVEDEVMDGPFAAREETVTFLSSHELEEASEPHTIGFYNPGNLCWMNSVVQCVIGLSPLMGDIQEHIAEGTEPAKYSNVLRGLIKILSVRQQGFASRVNDCLRKFHKSLDALKPQFATDTQQDCPEFLTELLDHLRDEFYRLSRNEGATLREISDNAPGATAAQRDTVPNPVRDNTEISMKQRKTCVSCSETVVGEIREPILLVDVPDLPKCSLQHALKGYFKSADIERQCDGCGAKTSRTTTAINRLPRVLIVQLKRYICKERTPETTFPGIEKVNSRVRIPEWLSVQDLTTEDVQLPSVRVSSAAPTPLPVFLDESSNQEDRELEEAKLLSLADDAEEEQLRQALAASMLDAPRSLPGSVPNTPVKDAGTPLKEDEAAHTRDYRLVAFIQHMGINPNSGHYTSSVYNIEKACWMNYNDSVVARQTFEVATGDRAQKNGYVFFYLHRSQFEAQAAAFESVANVG